LPTPYCHAKLERSRVSNGKKSDGMSTAGTWRGEPSLKVSYYNALGRSGAGQLVGKYKFGWARHAKRRIGMKKVPEVKATSCFGGERSW